MKLDTSSEADLNVNSSNYLDSINETQMENNGKVLNICWWQGN